MTKFKVLRAISDVTKFSEILFEICKNAKSAEDLENDLITELSEEGLQTVMSVAQSGNYPLSLDGLQ